MNCYASLSRLKSRLDITATTYDTDLVMVLNAASRAVDNYTKRYFYIREGTHYFDGSSSPFFMPEDLLSIDASGFKLDEDGDVTYEATLATGDYFLYPHNDFPKTYVKVTTNSNYGGFASGIKKGISIAGKFGYGDGESATPYTDSGATITVTTNTNTTVNASDGSLFGVGQTILAGSEQLYISAISSNTLTCKRGINGTTAAIQNAATASIYNYPDSIVEATLIQAMRWWKRRESAFADVIGSSETGGIVTAYKGIDPDIKEIIQGYIRRGC